MNIEVFPDYCSTGLWDSETRANIHPEEIDTIADDAIARALFAGLRQWHWVWEFEFTEMRLTMHAYDIWYSDGAELVAALNKHYAGKRTFTYRTDLLGV